jgi:hypothetical protein
MDPISLIAWILMLCGLSAHGDVPEKIRTIDADQSAQLAPGVPRPMTPPKR